MGVSLFIVQLQTKYDNNDTFAFTQAHIGIQKMEKWHFQDKHHGDARWIWGHVTGQKWDRKNPLIIQVHKLSKILSFHDYKNSLHYHDTANRYIIKIDHDKIDVEKDVMLLNNVIKIVACNKNNFLACQVEAASRGRKLYAM
eukprot:14175629-Ditylum_brightwellii.AAC.2